METTKTTKVIQWIVGSVLVLVILLGVGAAFVSSENTSSKKSVEQSNNW